MDVTFGRGHTIWKFADCTSPDQNGWQSCAVDADVVAARAAGLSYGFFIYDEVGSIWSLKNRQFKYTHFPNRFIYSRESDRSAPWLEVWFQGQDSIPPDSIPSINVTTAEFPAGQALVSWKTPLDRGGGKTLGFHVSYKRGVKEKAMPRYLIPMAGKAGEEVRMHVHDLSFKPGELISLTIRPVDSAGNIGPPFTKAIRVSANPHLADIPKANVEPFLPSTILPTVGGLKVSVVDLLDKIDPESGAMIPRQHAGYKGGNHIYSAKKKLIRLQTARNEHIAFQLNLEGKAEKVFINYIFPESPYLRPEVFQFGYVNVKDDTNKTTTPLPDPLLPFRRTCSVPATIGEVSILNQTNHSLICELYVPHEALPGRKKGKVTVAAGGEFLELEVDLTVWNFTLPNKLSFVPEMNAYGTVSPFKGYEYYRLAHEHRTCINRLPYNWSGAPSFAPKWNERGFNWIDWDRKVGPLLNGSAFKNSKRKNEPLDVLYLPFNENWPISLFDNYTPSYWADEAFTPEYAADLKKIFAAFARHCDKKGWYDTIFQFYLNNKVYQRRGFNRNSAPWVFDEPVNTQDFWALRWYGILWHSAVDPVKGKTKMWYRGDISYSQFGRNILWGIMDEEYLGSNNSQKTRMKHDEQILWGKSHFFEYGSANKIESPNTQPALWCLLAWSRGAMGVLPWQTIGNKKSWKKAEQTALFYSHPDGPMPSVRLKAFTRGQQDVEYLTLLGDSIKMPRYAVAGWLRGVLNLEGSVYRASASAAGTMQFEDVNTTDLWKLRCRVGTMLSKKAPKYKRSLVDWETPSWDIKKLPDIGYVRVSPKVERYKPDCDTFRP